MEALLKRMERMEDVLERLEPKIIEIHAFISASIPHLATKAEITAVQLEISHCENRISDRINNEANVLSEKINHRPTTAVILTIFGLMAAIAAVPWKELYKLFSFE
ncbi:hypothetical protein [Azospirillum argentinense]|uniref:hypothetical protein n=1 Tax=Azospirillum argentinense TaxID=2970906 RepID=UPI001185A665|nr:hypothetical protein [Azospirillum argentinense]